MVGGVSGGVLLDSDLGNMVDLVVNLVSNMVDNRGSGDMDSRCSIGNWSSNMVNSRNNSWSSFHFNSFDLSNSGGRGNTYSRGSSINTSYQAMSIGKVLSLCLSISSRGCKSAGSKRKNNQELHV